MIYYLYYTSNLQVLFNNIEIDSTNVFTIRLNYDDIIFKIHVYKDFIDR